MVTKWKLIVVELVIISAVLSAGLVAASGNVVAAERDSCFENPITVSSGENYSGTVNGPNDRDGFIIPLGDGEYTSFKVTMETAQDRFYIDQEAGAFQAGTNAQIDTLDYTDNILVPKTAVEPMYGRLFANRKADHCLEIADLGRDARYPYDYTIEFEVNGKFQESTPEPTETPTPSPTPTLTPTESPTPTPTPTASPTESPTLSPTETEVTSGSDESTEDTEDSDGDGIINANDYAPDDPEVQEKSDLVGSSGGDGPGFTLSGALVALIAGVIIAIYRA